MVVLAGPSKPTACCRSTWFLIKRGQSIRFSACFGVLGLRLTSYTTRQV